MAFLSDEEQELFQSDFKIVADYFVQMRKNKDYKPSKQIIQHVDELLKMMSVLTGDNRFEEAQISSKGGGTSMCEVLDRVEMRGLTRGREEGMALGREEGMELGLERGLEQGLKAQVFSLKELGASVEVAYNLITQSPCYASVTMEQVKKLYHN